MDNDKSMATKKKRRIEKQNRRKHPEISREIILIWEELRQKNVKSDRKHELCEKILSASKSVLGELIRQKATARVYESVIEFGVDEHRWTIFEIIKKDLLELCTGQYSYFAVKFMLKYGTKEQRMSVFELMRGHIVDLLQHAHASKVVEAAFNEFANSKQRSIMIQEFYGKAFALFSDGTEIKHLSDFTANSNYDMTILNNIHQVILPIIRKQHIDLTIVQHILLEYTSVLLGAIKKLGEDSSQQYEQLFSEILEAVNEQFLKLCNTREGTKLAILLFNECSSKLRKKIIQPLKEVIVDTCQHPDAHLFVLAVLDQTDDTKLLDKSIIKPIVENLDAISDSVHGRKCVQFVLNHRDKRFCSKFVLDILQRGDGNRISKKDAEIRAKEILEGSNKSFLKWLEGKVDDCLKYTCWINLACSIMGKCLPINDEMKLSYNNILSSIVLHIDEPVIQSELGGKRKAVSEINTVVKKKAKNFTGKFENDEENKTEVEAEETRTPIDCHLLESLGGNILVKLLCKLEKEGKIDGFSKMCIENISGEHFPTFLNTNRSSFFLVFLYEIGNESIQLFLKNILQSSQQKMSKSELPGVKILYKHLF